MASKDRTQELLKALSDAVVVYDEEAVAKLSKVVLQEGIDPLAAITSGLATGIEKALALISK